jgi:hypothetical protein
LNDWNDWNRLRNDSDVPDIARKKMTVSSWHPLVLRGPFSASKSRL